jgi:hypothetical protein
MKKFLLALMALLVIASPLAIAGPASAATTTAPTTSAPSVARGHTIKVAVNAHGSKVLSRTSTLWQNGHRIYDWSPKPGLYKVKSVLRYQTKTTTTTDDLVWTPYEDCEDYSYDGYDACAEDEIGYWDNKVVTTLSAARSITRYNYSRVYADETPGCVSYSEFKAVKNGMTQARVHSIFGTTGKVTYSGSGGTGREYKTCTGDPDWSYVDVDFNPRVWFKWRYISSY